MRFLEQVCPDPATPPLADDLIGVITARAFLEEAIIRRIAEAVALKDKDAVFALAVELVAVSNE